MTHTWDIHLHYHRCPHCGYIAENRDKFEYESLQFVKKVSCPRCKKEFKDAQKKQVRLGPFFTDSSNSEND